MILNGFIFRDLLKVKYYGLALVSLLFVLFLQTAIIALPTINNPLKPPDTSSPQATMKSFINNLNASYEVLMEAYDEYLKEPNLFPSASVQEKADTAQIFFDRASECLDLSQIGDSLKSNVKTEVTLLLKETLDRIDFPYYTEIPDEQTILDLQEKEIELNKWNVPKTKIQITKVQKGERAGEYLFSPETVARAAEFYQKVKGLPYNPDATEGFYEFYSSTPGQLLPPKWFKLLPKSLHAVFWDQTLWQWLGMLIILLITGLIILFIFQLNQRQTAKLNLTQKYLFRTISPAISLAILWIAGDLINYQLNITGYVLMVILNLIYFSRWAMVALIFFLLSQAVGEVVIGYFEKNENKVDTTLIRTFADLISLGIGGLVLLFGVQRLGVNLFPLFAGLGVGGLAIALGAQSTLENVIAGLALFFDRPVVAGEDCIFGDYEGTVQSIGLRSIRLQGPDGNLMSMPNSEFAQLQLTNTSRAKKSLFKHKIHCQYQTTSEQLKLVLAEFYNLLVNHENTLEEGLYVRLVGYNQYAIVIEIQAYIDTGDNEEFLVIQESLLLRIKEIMEEVKIQVSLGI